MAKTPSIDLHTIIPCVAQGDEKAFALLYRHYYGKLIRFLRTTNKSAEDIAGDILQEAFFRVWINRDKLMEIEDFEAWLFKVVANESLSAIRQELHIKTKTNRWEQELEKDTSTRCYKPIELIEVKQIVADAINSMPAQRQKIYRLSRENGMTPSQIAVELNISLPTVYNTLTSALKHIRQHLIAAGYGSSLYILLMLGFF